MLRAALDLAEAGWAVLPLNGKTPTTGHTPHGHLDATTDPKRIREWWADGNWNIGAPVPENLLALDIDPRNDGSLEALEQRAGVKLPDTLEVISGRRDGGRHLYYLRPFRQPYRGNVPPGIDVKINGYMVMPPSVHPDSRKPYEWVYREVAHLPRQVAALMLPRTRVTRRDPSATDAIALAAFVRTLRPGERHDGLHWAARRAHEAGVDQRGLDRLIDAAEDIGMDPREARRVVESAGRDNA
ncbi:bifunctional DNA primase/polymerase [Microbacterium sp. NPDC096154]|uniref:bifunctional DNA primase/polymerase n=1 Tax=Microbacterium sp. NPDC096154 TaxID=3155549 RepID=UPI0033223236